MPEGEELSKLLGILSIRHNLLFIIIAWLTSTNGFHFLKPFINRSKWILLQLSYHPY